MLYRVFDGHCDTLARCLERGSELRQNAGYVDLTRCAALGQHAQIFAIFADSAAVMTFQASVSVICQAYITVLTFDRFPAGSAGHKVCIASAVHKQHRLFALVQAVFYKLM